MFPSLVQTFRNRLTRRFACGCPERSFISVALLGSVLLWIAQPPLAWSPVGWVALVPWFYLSGIQLHDKPYPYRWLWVAGCVFWLVTLQGIRHAHPAMFLGWFALSGYLATYVPVAVGLIRVAAGYGIPLMITGPTIWTGLELVRGYFATGFSANLLGHSQVDIAPVAQIADAFGSYGVSFVVATSSAALATLLLGRHHRPQSLSRWVLSASWFSVVAVTATLVYGNLRIAQIQAMNAQANPLATIALVQRNEPVDYIMPTERHQKIFDSYIQGSIYAMRSAGSHSVDLVVWPESTFGAGSSLTFVAQNASVPEGWNDSLETIRKKVQYDTRQRSYQVARLQRQLQGVSEQLDPPAMLVGCSVVRFAETIQQYSGAVLFSKTGEWSSWYGKQHLVMFGEYIPFAKWVPWIYQWLQMASVTPGAQPVLMKIGSTNVAPNICFETVVEHVTIDQIRQLDAEGTPPDIVINLTNDAWFDGTSILDHHRRCSQIVAIGCRRPILMASNTGPTVWIDGSGQLVEQLPKMTHGTILARPKPDGRWGLYQAIGDWPAKVMAMACGLLGLLGIRERLRRRDSESLHDE